MNKNHNKFLEIQAGKLHEFLESYNKEKEEFKDIFVKKDLPKVEKNFKKVYNEINFKMKKMWNYVDEAHRQGIALHRQYDDFFESERNNRLEKLREQGEEFINKLVDFEVYSEEKISDFMDDLREQMGKGK